MEKMTLKQELKAMLGLSESDFHNHESDLYVLYSPGVEKYLKENYEFWESVEKCYSNVKGQAWYKKSFFDIPFAYMNEHYANR